MPAARTISCPQCLLVYVKYDGEHVVYTCGSCGAQFNQNEELLVEGGEHDMPSKNSDGVEGPEFIHPDPGTPWHGIHGVLGAMKFQTQSVPWMRKQARILVDAEAVNIDHPQPGTWIASATKGQLVELLTTGAWVPAYKKQPAPPAPEIKFLSSQEIRDRATGIINKETPQAMTPEITLPVTTPATNLEAAAKFLEMLTPKVTIDENMVRAIVDDAIAKQVPRRLEIVVPDKPPVVVERQHKQFKKLVQILSTRKGNGCRVAVWIYGPAGSGKTHSAEVAAEALGLPFYAISVGPQTTKSDLMGYMDATGKYVESLLYKAYKYGGVIIIDEIDAAHPGVLTMVNALLANGQAAFPCGMVKRHVDFCAVAGANTVGAGASRQYVGRMQQDAATRDRWVFLAWEYDEPFERELTGNDEWHDYVLKVRRAVEKLGLREVVSPRASFDGAALLAAGLKDDDVKELTLFAKMDPDSVKRVKEAL